MMYFLRKLLLLVTLLLMGFSVSSHAAERAREVASKPAAKLMGTWHSAEGDITFKPNGVLVYKGKRHYFAVANSMIEITGKHGERMMLYQLSGDKLTLTDNNKKTEYFRK